MPRVKAGPLRELPPGRMSEYRNGEIEIAICNVDGRLYAIDNHCPHAGGPLAQGALHGTAVVCPWHAWEFDCSTGVCDFNSDIRVGQYAVTVEDGEIFVEV